jgi:hypothetical protein
MVRFANLLSVMELALRLGEAAATHPGVAHEPWFPRTAAATGSAVSVCH